MIDRPIGHTPGDGWDVSSRTRSAAVLLLCLATLWLFAPLSDAGFVTLDDGSYVTANPFVYNGITWKGVRWALTDTRTNWHPLTWLSHMLDCQLFGLDPGAHHVVNVVLHAANAGLLLYVLTRLTGVLWPSAFVALLFAVHPLHVESVAWISERKDLLSTLFFLGAILAYLRFVGRRSAARYAVICGAMVLSLLSKPMAVTLPVTLLLLDYWPLRRWPPPDAGAPADVKRKRAAHLRGLMVEKVPLVMIAIGAATLTVVAQRSMQALRSFDEVPLGLRVTTALVSYASYAWKMLYPTDLAIPYPLHPELPAWQVVGASVWLVVTSALVVANRTRRPYLLVGWCWYLVTLLPVIGLVSVGSQAGADRYTYVPLIGLFVMAGWTAADHARGHSLVRVSLVTATVGIVLACTLLTRRQMEYWNDSIALFSHTIAVTRNNAVAESSLAAALREDDRWEESFAHITAALRISPRFEEAHNNLGILLLEHGRLGEAEREFREAQRLRPGYASPRRNMGVLRLQQHDPTGARDEFTAALAIDPGDATAQFGLAKALDDDGLPAAAAAAYERAAALDPARSAAIVRAAELQEASGDHAAAIAHYREALRRRPGDPAIAAALRRLGGAAR